MSTFSIGDATFDAVSGEIAGPRGTTRLAPQPASLLGLLVEHATAVVSRDAIREHLWPNGKVEFDQGIAFAVREIRKALEEVGADPSLIETIPKRGLRLRDPHERRGRADARPEEAARVGPSLDGEVVAPSRTPPRPHDPAPRRRARAVALALSGVAVAAALVVVGLALGSDDPPVIVVFRHDARDGDAAADLADRLSNALTASLTEALTGTAGVVGPTGTERLAGPDDTEAARELLHACLVLSGAIEAIDAGGLVVFTQIVRTADRVHTWARLDTLPEPDRLGPSIAEIERGVRASLPDC